MSLTLARRHNVDRFGYLIPHRYGNLPMVGAVATYRPGEGRFGGAVAVEEGTTNKFATESGAAQDWSKWSHWDNRTYWQSVTQYDDPVMGKVFQGTAGNTAYLHHYYPYAFTSGVQYTLSVYLKADRVITKNLGFFLVSRVGGQHTIASENLSATITTEWQRFSVVLTPNETTAIGEGGLGINFRSGNEGVVYYAALPQLEQKPFATSFVDGSRNTGVLTYPPGITNRRECTIVLWVKVDYSNISLYHHILTIGSGTAERLWWWYREDQSNWTITTSIGGSGSNFVWAKKSDVPEGWRMFSISWNPDQMNLYVDDENVFTVNNPKLSEALDNAELQVGHWAGGRPLNMLIDELLILPYAASEEEIASWYEAQGPMPPHPQASLQWDWQAVRPAQMVKL